MNQDTIVTEARDVEWYSDGTTRTGGYRAVDWQARARAMLEWMAPQLRAAVEAEAAQRALDDVRAKVAATFPAFSYYGDRHTTHCNQIVFPGSTGPDPEPPEPCVCGGPEMFAALQDRGADREDVSNG